VQFSVSPLKEWRGAQGSENPAVQFGIIKIKDNNKLDSIAYSKKN